MIVALSEHDLASRELLVTQSQIRRLRHAGQRHHWQRAVHEIHALAKRIRLLHLRHDLPRLARVHVVGRGRRPNRRRRRWRRRWRARRRRRRWRARRRRFAEALAVGVGAKVDVVARCLDEANLTRGQVLKREANVGFDRRARKFGVVQVAVVVVHRLGKRVGLPHWMLYLRRLACVHVVGRRRGRCRRRWRHGLVTWTDAPVRDRRAGTGEAKISIVVEHADATASV